MGAAAYNRGSRAISAEADGLMSAAQARADRQALKDEIARLRYRIARLDGELTRARRCLAAERLAREKRVGELKDELRASELCPLAFPGDVTTKGAE